MTLDETVAFVRTLHAGHRDILGRPYHTHLERVLAHLLRLFPDAGEDERRAALLHGAVEEKRITLAALRRAGFSEAVVEMVAWNTRPRGSDAPPYLDWIRDLSANAPLGAVRIKIADNEDNNDPRRIACLPEAERGVSEAYAKARAILDAALRARQ